jgi:hypothetical protein
MKTLVYSLVIAAVFVAGGCGSTSGNSSFRTGYDFSTLEKVAIVSISGEVKGQAAKDQIAELFAMEFIQKGYTLIGIAQTKALLGQMAESPVKAADLTAAKATIVGKALNVPAVVIVNVPNFGQEITMTAELINVEDGSTLWMGSGSSKSSRSVPETIIGTFTGGPKEQPEAETDAAKAMTSREIAKIQKVITRICSSLPAKNSAAHTRSVRAESGSW